MTKFRKHKSRTHRRMRRRQQSRRRNMRKRCGGKWGVPSASFREVMLYKNNGANNRFPPNLFEQNFNEKGEITNTQLNERLHEGRGLRSPGRFVITNIPGITHAERQNKLLTFYAGDEPIGSIIINELESGDREDKPDWMSIL